jgi:hypothetical protein
MLITGKLYAPPLCHGVQIMLVERQALDAPSVGCQTR